MRLRKKPWIARALEDYTGKELLEDHLEEYRGNWSKLLGDRPVHMKSAAAKESSWQK